MNVSATDKSTSKTEKITISNDKGRLSKDDIERLVKEAEKFKGEDDIIRKKVDAKNGLENYIYSIKNALIDEKFKGKFTEEDTGKINPLLTST